MKIRILSVASIVVLMVGLLAAFPSDVVQAQDPQPTPGGQYLQNAETRVENAFRNVQNALNRQEDFEVRAQNSIARVEELIAKGKSHNLDTSDLESALASYKSSLASAQAYHDQAASIVSGAAGFDSSGNVTDLETARATVKSAAEALRNAASAMKGSGQALAEAVKGWVEANKGAFNEKLEEDFANLQEWFGIQDTNIGRLKDAQVKLAEFIDEAKARGDDTSALEAVLADLKSQIPQSESYHNQADGILSSHAGFDGSGKVTDPKTARDTLKAAGEQLNASKNINVALAQELKKAAEDWKAAHPKSEAVPTVPVTGG